MGTLGRTVIAVAALGLTTAHVHAEEGPVVRVGGLAPFSEAELAEALRLRLGGAHEVEVVSGARVITISVDGKSRSIRLGSERGQEAARVVALVAAALVLDAAPEASVAIEVGAAADVGARVASVALVGASRHVDDVAPAVVPAARRWTVAGLVAPGVAARTQAAAGALLAYEWPAGDDGVRAQVAVGLTSSSVELAAPAPALRTLELPVRAGAWLGDRLAVGAAAVAVPSSTSGGAGDRDVLVGAGIMARARVTVGGRIGLVAQVGVDGMVRSVEYRWGGEPVLASGRVRPWLALGLTWAARP